MGTKYSSNATSGYNSTPPADDGTVSEANKVKWSTVKTKLSDPVKTLADTINSELVTHFDNGPTAITTNTTLDASHYNKIIEVSGSGVTLTLSDATTLTAGWYCDVRNVDTTNSVTIARTTASDTFNGVTSNYTLVPYEAMKIAVKAAANGFYALNESPKRVLSDDGATVGPTYTLDRYSASPAASDVIGGVKFDGRDSGAGTDTYAQIQAEIVDPTATSEDGLVAIQTKVAGTLASRLKVAQGVYTSGATGTDKGTDTINTNAYYDKGSLASHRVLIQTQSASSSATIDFTTGIDSTFDVYEVDVLEAVPSTDDVNLYVRVSEDSGSTWKSGGTDYYTQNATTSAFDPQNGVGAGNAISNVASESGYSANIRFIKLAGTSSNKSIFVTGAVYRIATGGAPAIGNTYGAYVGTTNAVNGIRFLMSSGNIASGTFNLYGIKK